MRRLPAKLISPALQLFIRHYFKKPRAYRYKKIRAVVNPGVFFPHFTLSTRLLIQFLEDKNLKGKRFLELGCGTGMISVFAAGRGALVTASDINPAAIENTQLNASKNKVILTTILSDLFTKIPPQIFDCVIINPPYYPKNPKTDAEKAWFCGENFEYFERLFSELGVYFNSESAVYMILSEDCQFEKINALAQKNHFELVTVFQKQKWGEISFIYEVVLIPIEPNRT